jgi:hypothetical protein
MSELSLSDLLNEKEWRRCGPDWAASTPEELLDAFLYFCANYVFIRHPERGRIKFELREAQIETVEVWLGARQSIALKARQIGFSTLVSVYCFWLTFFYDDRTVVMLSKTERDSAKLLQHAKYAYRFLPEWMKMRGPVVTSTQLQMSMTNESVVESLPSASDPARGVTAFLIVVDEMGHLPNSEEAWAAIEPVADVGGRIIMLGTANGEGNLFHKTWVGSQNGTNGFVGIFHPWSAGDRDDEWYEVKKATLPDWQLAQEYPSNPDEAFLRSGRPVFNVDALREIVTVPPLHRGYLRKAGANVEFVDDGGALRVWEMPEPSKVYCVGADVAEGLQYGDYSSAHVMNARTGVVVAHWHGHVDPDLFGSDVLCLLGKFYNDALVGVESNNHGLTTLKALVREKYRNVYRQRRLDKRFAAPTESLGWRTTSASKPLAIDELGKALRDGSMGLVDAETIAELRTFVREGNGKMHGSPHDDRVMSLAITNQMLKYVWLREYRAKQPEPGPGTLGWFINNMFDDNEEKGDRRPIGAFAVRAASH